MRPKALLMLVGTFPDPALQWCVRILDVQVDPFNGADRFFDK